MTKDQLQKELKSKVKPGIKPSDLRKLKRSKSADDIPTSPAQSIPLKKSQSHLEIPLQPSSKEQITQLQEQVKFSTQTASNYLQALQKAQAKVSGLETDLSVVKAFNKDLQEQLKDNPPTQLLTDQLSEKQQQIESLRQELEIIHQALNSLKATQSTLLDTNLSLKHQSLKD
jgi:chromosome segregation ATPase